MKYPHIPFEKLRYWTFVAAVLGMVSIAQASELPAGDEPIRFRFAISSRLFTGVNENDAKASIKVWARTAVGTSGVPLHSEAVFIDSTEGFIAAFKEKEIEAACLSSEQYVAIQREVELSDQFAEAIQVRGGETFLLLVHEESNFRTPEDLKGHNLMLYDHVRANLAMLWLDVFLAKQGLVSATNHFGDLIAIKKLSSVVLPVFFRKADACLVPKTSFDTLVELNPQLGRKLRPVAASQKLVTGVSCFRANWDPPRRAEIVASFLNMDSTPAGQQILTVFQAGKLGRISDAELATVRELLDDHQRFFCTSRSKSIDPTTISIAPVPPQP